MGIRPAFQSQKKLAAVFVLPCAGVDRAAAQADDDGQVLDAHRALELAGAAGGALKSCFLGVVFAQQRLFRGRAEVVQIAAQAEDNFFWIQQLAGIGGGTVLGAAAALYTGVGLQGCQTGEISAGDEAEVFVAHQRRNLAEAAAREKNGGRAKNQVQVLGVGDDGQKG